MLSACVGSGAGYQGPAGRDVPSRGAGMDLPPASRVTTSSGRILPANAPIVQVVARLEPVAEALCRQHSNQRNCDFVVGVDDDPSAQANAYQTLDDTGRPVIVFTQSLIDMARNQDELAFVLGHETAHHIAGHIPRRLGRARMGAVLAGVIGQVSGLSGDDLVRVQEYGAGLAAQGYSKEYELEADGLGAEVAWIAGYDPMRGAAFFARLPDPGEQMLGTHPANAQRQAVVAARVRALSGAGR